MTAVQSFGIGYSMTMLCISIAIVIVLCICFKIHAFVSLTAASLFLALTHNMELAKIVMAFEGGLGKTLGFLAPILALGAILGKLMEVSGAAERLARTLINILGQSKAHWAMMVVGYICGIPVFLQVGIILLTPLMFSIVKESKLPLIQVGMALVVALTTVHCIVPPHPAAMAVTDLLKADVGKVIFFGLLVGLPAASIAGPIYGKFIAKRLPAVPLTGVYANTEPRKESELPPFGSSLLVMLLPLLLMIAKTVVELTIDKQNPPAYMPYVNFIGTPMIALFISAVVAYIVFGLKRGFNWDQLGRFSEQGMAPLASIMLVIGAAGALNQIITDSGVGVVLKQVLTSIQISPLILAWIIAIALRFALGSATVSMMTAAGLILPVLSSNPGIDPALMAIVIGAGATGASHVTDSGFWFVKESLGIPMGSMYATYTAGTTIASVLGLFGTLLLSMFL
ncbi:permease DsdX [Desulfovibrio sp. UIB00]|uniref:GntT/GntP/DsdX family permease n=1 Tax=unclassified Desulfovibrio TaxID=2593640 RepID=UPI001F0FD9BC|nr:MULTISPECIES: gluconate:H+ symporter [unclassified Desulfovibrio]MCH5143613.1 permease DsdX [Desulfovibrio sp. UIB00]